jgi:hypothetical protein
MRRHGLERVVFHPLRPSLAVRLAPVLHGSRYPVEALDEVIEVHHLDDLRRVEADGLRQVAHSLPGPLRTVARQDPLCGLLGPRLDEQAPQDLQQPLGILHGGVVANRASRSLAAFASIS